MRGALQPASVPPEFLQQVKDWAKEQPDLVSVILFGSRARGDHDAGSDWDFALVYDGERPSLDGLPYRLPGRGIDWVPMERADAMRLRNLCGIQHAVAAQGHCLYGTPLPPPERSDMNEQDAWGYLTSAAEEMFEAAQALGNYWGGDPDVRRHRRSTNAAAHSAMAGELLCKATLAIKGVQPDWIHSVEYLCDALDKRFPGDALLPALRKCNGRTTDARMGLYPGVEVEKIEDSMKRLRAALRASGGVFRCVCSESAANAEVGPSLEDALRWMSLAADAVRALESTHCPPEEARKLEAATHGWPGRGELRQRLKAPAPTKAQARQGRTEAAPRGR